MKLNIRGLLFALILFVCLNAKVDCQPKNFYKIWKEQQEIQKNLTLTQANKKEDSSSTTTTSNVNYDDYLIDDKDKLNSDYDNELSDETEHAESIHERSRATTTTTTLADYDDETYDDLEEKKMDKTSVDHTLKLKKQCPSICKCSFYNVNKNYDYERKRLKRKSSGKEYSGEEDYSTSSSSSSSTTHNSDYEYQYEDNGGDLITDEAKSYEIHVDCSYKNLNSISNLFDYDFPLEQVVSL
jgi:hypothetical protein